MPRISPAAWEHSQTVSAHISRLIGESGGALPFDKYMEHVLYAPGLGYYAAGAVKLGPAGDFVTAPETGLLFGQCLADEVADILGHMPNAAILEFGAGSGRLAEVLIQTLAALNRLPSRYIIIELSPDLRDRQQRTLAALADKVGVPIEWRDQMPEPGVEAVVIANEVLDAFPVTRFRVEKDGVRHAGVREEEQGFSWDWSSPILSQGPEFDVARRFLPG